MPRRGPVPCFLQDGRVVRVVAISALARVLLVYELGIVGRASNVATEMG